MPVDDAREVVPKRRCDQMGQDRSVDREATLDDFGQLVAERGVEVDGHGRALGRCP